MTQTPPSQPVTPPKVHCDVLPISPTRSSYHYFSYIGTEISDELIDSCAELFSMNYGFWGEKAPSVSKFTKPGQLVKMTGRRLQTHCLSVPDRTVLVMCIQKTQLVSHAFATVWDFDRVMISFTCFQESQLVGHAFTTVWDFDRGVIGWITQLVVDINARKRYIATQLLQTLKTDPLFMNITAIGLVSSHPAACDALTKYVDIKINVVDLDFCRDHAKNIIETSPVEYIQTMQLHGQLFEESYIPGTISTVYTEFFVEHDEPLQALDVFKARGDWPLGELLDGHEFLIILPVKALKHHETNVFV